MSKLNPLWRIFLPSWRECFFWLTFVPTGTLYRTDTTVSAWLAYNRSEKFITPRRMAFFIRPYDKEKTMNTMKKTIAALAVAATTPVYADPAAPEKPALIDVVSTQEATGDVAKVYDEIQAQWQFVPNPIKLYSTNPEMLRMRWEGYKAAGAHKTVDPQLQTIIRMLVSADHSCQYCIGVNEAFLINDFKMNPKDVVAMKKHGAVAAPLPEKQKDLLAFALKATKHPKSTTAADIDGLHKLGWSDAEIFFATSYAAEMVASDILINAFHVAIDY